MSCQSCPTGLATASLLLAAVAVPASGPREPRRETLQWFQSTEQTGSRLKLLLRQPIPCGLAFGVVVYFFMKKAVVPLSAARPIPFTWAGLVGHAFLVGLPIALVARWKGQRP